MTNTLKKKTKEAVDKLPTEKYVWNKRILIIEDQKDVAGAYKEILGEEANSNLIDMKRSSRKKEDNKKITYDYNFDLTFASSGEQALELIKKSYVDGKPFSMAFVDVRLGKGIDGIELVRNIFELDNELYCVFVTAYQDRAIDSIHELLGTNKAYQWDYINKPFTHGEILQKARNFVTFWNLQKEKKHRDVENLRLREMLVQGERQSTAAAVARSVSHEFGNIMQQIMGKAELSLKKDEAGKTEAIEKIIEASQRATEILDNFKSLSDVRASGKKELTSINQLIESTLSLMEHQLTVGTVKICKIKFDPIEAEVNPTSLMQVLLNVLMNASYAMPHSGQLDISLEKKDKGFSLIIRDYGSGIDKDILQRVLEPLFTTKGSDGSGLGLSICKEIIEVEHKGSFRLINHAVMGLEVHIEI